MIEVTGLLLVLIAALLGCGFLAFAVVSLGEGERRAAIVASACAVLVPIPLLLALLLPTPLRAALLVMLAVATAAAWFAPVGRGQRPSGRPDRRFDERDIMFARGRLRPGSTEYETYYAMRPQHQAGDDRTRALPGLMSPAAERAEPVAFAAAESSFVITGALRNAVNGPVAATQVERPPTDATHMVKRLARYWGALTVGICELQPYHVYSHIGRGSGTWGDPIELDHSWAVAFTVEMDHAVMACAPEAAVVAESARQYARSAVTAVELASAIRRLGYKARAHIDGNYRVIAPLVAKDAGLGEIGRMGLVMTPGLGPRVRLGVVTTNLPLIADAPSDDPTVIDFCTICKKCADCCPTASIPSGDRAPIDSDGLRWAIDDQTCFRYWNVVGSDCGRCMAVCPYSHPDSAAHNLVRWAIRRSGSARRLLLWMDDLFYGRKPQPRDPATARIAPRP